MENDVKRMKTNMVASVDCLAASAESKKNPHWRENRKDKQTSKMMLYLCQHQTELLSPSTPDRT